MVDNDLQRSSLDRLNGLNAMVGNFAATSSCHYLDSVHECELYNVHIILHWKALQTHKSQFLGWF